MNILNLSLDERPRERVVNHGIRVLSDAELIALIIGSGCGKKNALDIGRDIINYAEGSIKNLASWEIDDFCNIKGVGLAKAIQLKSVFELARRRDEVNSQDPIIVKDSFAAYKAIRVHLEDLPNEEFWGMFFNNANKLIFCQCMSKGGMTSAIVDIRILIRKALSFWASGIIIVHNHPSGVLIPSNNDIAFTKKLKKALSTVQIRLLDHLVLGDRAYYSFADEGLI